MEAQAKTAIIYDDLVDIRFSDLDFYNHVNSKHYIDIISTARLSFLAREMKTPIEEVTRKGIGFFMTKSTVNYKRPIQGLQRVRAKSHVQEIRDQKVLIIPFVISNENETKVFADGILEFALIDMNSKRSVQCPDWVLDLFYK